MSRRIYELVQQLEMEQLEVTLALQCAPLIAGLKISNLLIISRNYDFRLRELARKSGLCAFLLFQSDDKSTFLLFNQCQLKNFLSSASVLQLLTQYGYTHFSLGKILSHFSCRYRAYMENRQNFPHEMGVLLGYPIEDVIGFINNSGQNFLYSGYWKVYANVPDKVRLFYSYDRAKEEILHQLVRGRNIENIILNYKELQKAAV